MKGSYMLSQKLLGPEARIRASTHSVSNCRCSPNI